MQTFGTSIPLFGRGMPAGGGLPLCLSGIRIMTQVRPKETLLQPYSNRCRSQSFTAERDDVTHTSLSGSYVLRGDNASSVTTWGEGQGIHRKGCTAVLADGKDHEATVHIPRSEVTQEMAELDRRREALKQERSVQGLGPYLREHSFLVTRHARRPEIIHCGLPVLPFFEPDENLLLGNCGAKAA